MANYREIAQDYANGAIKSVILVNGAGAAAVLAQLASLTEEIPRALVGWSIISFVAGVTVGCLCWFFGYVVARYVDRAERGQDPNYDTANRWMHIGEGAMITAIALFLAGALFLAIPFATQRPA